MADPICRLCQNHRQTQRYFVYHQLIFREFREKSLDEAKRIHEQNMAHPRRNPEVHHHHHNHHQAECPMKTSFECWLPRATFWKRGTITWVGSRLKSQSLLLMKRVLRSILLWYSIKKIPSEMEEAPPRKLLTLLTLLTSIILLTLLKMLSPLSLLTLLTLLQHCLSLYIALSYYG